VVEKEVKMADIEFTSEDVGLLTEVLALEDLLLTAACATKLVEGVGTYPIESLAQLKDGFDRYAGIDKRLHLGRCIIPWEKVQTYLGKSRFPLRNRRQLLNAIVVSLEKEHFDTISSTNEHLSSRRR
jgi:hypothetical protein